MAALFAALLVASCATAPIVLDRADMASVKRVGVLAPGFPQQPTVAAQPVTNGALFLLVSGVQEANRSREFGDVLVRARVNPEAAFSKALLSCLGDAGVQVSAMPADARRTEFLKEYASLGAQDVDAVLDVVVSRYGYYAVLSSAPFMPSVVVQARLGMFGAGGSSCRTRSML